MLAQQASGYDVGGRKFYIKQQPMQETSTFFYSGMIELAKLTPTLG
jgi:hypothetical protein